ncbi:MAG: aldo/keto reductase [Alphaproteobacteria bacterium]|nr:aldo/keto reductase [Alphaproteobacteria bacterium]
MEKRKLGRTNIEVSALCLGSMTWGRQNTQDEAFAQMDYAFDAGINFMDTAELYSVPVRADLYGRTEEIIGNYFTSRKTRNKIILASKIAGPGLPWIRGGDYKIDRKNITEALENSLKRLKAEYIDLYQLHWPNREAICFGAHWRFNPRADNAKPALENFLEVLQTLGEFVKAGKIRNVGLSNETAWGTMQYLQIAEKYGLPRMVSIQNEYSLLYRLFEPDLAEIALHEDIGLLAWSPLATGALSGKYLDGARPEDSRWAIATEGRRADFRDTPQAQAATHAYMKLADENGLDVCQMALAFVRQKPFVTSVIIGATKMEHLQSNIASAQLTLDQKIIEKIEEVRRLYPVPF